MKTTQVAVDLAKSVFQVAVSHTPGRIDEQHRLSRTRFQRFFAEHRPVEVLMEACGTAHHWGRELEALGGSANREQAARHHLELLDRLCQRDAGGPGHEERLRLVWVGRTQ